MEKFSENSKKRGSTLPIRPGLKSKCEEEFLNLANEVEFVLSRKNEEHELKYHKMKDTEKKLLSKCKDLEGEINTIKQENLVLKHQNMILENSFKNQMINLKDQIKGLGEINNEQMKKNKEEVESFDRERYKLQDERTALEKHLYETQQQLNQLRKTEEKYVNTIKDLSNKLRDREDQIIALRNVENKAKKFPNDREVEALARKISERFLQEETQHQDGLKKKIMQKIKDIELKMRIDT